jgi:cell shape-determining protein MreD
MLSHLVSAIALVVFFILQTTIFSQTRLVSGTADIILLFLAAWSLQEQVKNSWVWTVISGVLVSLVSAMPFFTPLIGYLGVVGISKGLQRLVWRTPLLAMLIVVLVGTFFQQTVYVLALIITGAPISWLESLDRVILPSALLNLIFSLPIYAIAKDLAGRISPQEVEV